MEWRKRKGRERGKRGSGGGGERTLPKQRKYTACYRTSSLEIAAAHSSSQFTPPLRNLNGSALLGLALITLATALRLLSSVVPVVSAGYIHSLKPVPHHKKTKLLNASIDVVFNEKESERWRNIGGDGRRIEVERGEVGEREAEGRGAGGGERVPRQYLFRHNSYFGYAGDYESIFMI